MFTHSFLGTNDIPRSRTFYDAVMGALGCPSVPLPHGTVYPGEGGNLIVAAPANGEAHTVSNGHTLGFKAKDYAAVDAFHAAGMANGGTCEGPPGVRENAPGAMYGAYLRDPDGNKICAFAPNAGA
jgi:catechol 2,3-dioxygenase-like lactoylglutathione lyase family enzyme